MPRSMRRRRHALYAECGIAEIPISHAVGGQMRDEPIGDARRAVQHLGPPRLPIRSGESVDRPGLSASPHRAVGEPLPGSGAPFLVLNPVVTAPPGTAVAIDRDAGASGS